MFGDLSESLKMRICNSVKIQVSQDPNYSKSIPWDAQSYFH